MTEEMSIQEAVQLINQLITCGGFNRSKELLKDNLGRLDGVFFSVLGDFIRKVEEAGQKETAELLTALNKEALNLLKAKELGEEKGSPSSIFDLFISLAQEITQENLSLDEAIRRIREDARIRAMLDERTIFNLCASVESIAIQSPPLAYHLAYLTYEAAKVIESKVQQGYSSFTLANLSYQLAMYSEAIELYQEALAIAKELNDRQGVGVVLGNLGNAYLPLGEYRKAVGYFEDALRIAKEIENRGLESKWLGNLGNVYISFGEYQKAMGYFEDALRIAKEIGDVDNERGLNLNLGILYDDHLLQPEKAYKYYGHSIELSELIRGGLIEESQKIGFSALIDEPYYRIVPLCYKLDKEKEAYEYTERAKSRAFLDLLATTEIKPSVALPTELKQREDECLGLLRQVQRRPFEEAVPKPQVDVIKVAEELKVIYDQIERYDPEYTLLRRGRPLSFNQIHRLLETQGRRTALVEYFVTKEKVFIFVLRGDDLKLHIEEKSIPGEKLYRYIENYWREVANYLEYGDTRQTWQELSKYLIEPITKYLKEGDMIYIVPHGLLHYLPLHALKHDGKYLIEDFQIVYSPSASLIKYCQEKTHNSKDKRLVIGVPKDEDPESLKDIIREEAKKVAEILKTSPYLDEKATKHLVNKEYGGKDIIHFSCHGDFNPAQPILSGLLLSDGKRLPSVDKGDFISGECLNMNDIFNLKLNANLVTLSACKTGISDLRPGDELIGLIRGFLYAGTPSVVVSLWSVEAKSTQQLTEKFYTYLIT